MERILVTGGLGFIGSHFVDLLVSRGFRPLIVDADNYAGDKQRLSHLGDSYDLLRIDITSESLSEVVANARPELIVHLAAETHVTRSETNQKRFFDTNVEGTRGVLESAKRCGARVLHVSTDEVYGPCDGRPFREEDKAPGEGNATSAYARSKALGDDLARAFSDSLEILIARPTNCFGPWQHPEKAIPRWSIRAISNQPIPVWGDGKQVRDWMFVEDACEALWTMIEKAAPGDVYNIAPERPQVSNLEIAHIIARAADRNEDAVYLTAYDRPDHDWRYAVDASKLRNLGWFPQSSLEEQLSRTVDWYKRNSRWWSPLLAEAEELYSDRIPRAQVG